MDNDGSIPTQPVASDRDATGRFVRGNVTAKLGGRPRGIDARAAFGRAMGEVEAEKAVVDTLTAMLAAALKGDTAAARIVLERLCGPVRQEVDVAVEDARLDDATVVRRLHGMLALAASRVQQERN